MVIIIVDRGLFCFEALFAISKKQIKYESTAYSVIRDNRFGGLVRSLCIGNRIYWKQIFYTGRDIMDNLSASWIYNCDDGNGIFVFEKRRIIKILRVFFGRVLKRMGYCLANIIHVNTITIGLHCCTRWWGVQRAPIFILEMIHGGLNQRWMERIVGQIIKNVLRICLGRNKKRGQ